MRLKPRILAATAVSCLTLLLTAFPALGGGPDDPCRQDPCRAKLRVRSDVTKWYSAQTFYPQNEALVAVLRVEGRKLAFDEAFGPGACRSRYVGSGLMVIVKACGDVTPLRVRATRLKGPKRRLVVSYRAIPAIRGDA